MFDIEVQVADTLELPERARFYQSIMDIDSLKSGAPYSALKDSHVIFICLSDVFKRELPVYTFENRCAENPEIVLGDRSWKHFFIASNCVKMLQNEEQKAFFELLTTNKAETSFTNRLKAFVDDAKQNTQWRVQFMTWERQQHYAYENGKEAGIAIGEERGIAIGEERGERNAKLETARILKQSGVDMVLIEKSTGLSEAEIKEL